MAYDLVFTNQAVKDVMKIDKPTRKIIVEEIRKLKDFDNSMIHIKCLQGILKGYYRLDYKSFRIGFKCEEKIIIILTVGQRENFYKSLERIVKQGKK